MLSAVTLVRSHRYPFATPVKHLFSNADSETGLAIVGRGSIHGSRILSWLMPDNTGAPGESTWDA